MNCVYGFLTVIFMVTKNVYIINCVNNYTTKIPYKHSIGISTPIIKNYLDTK